MLVEVASTRLVSVSAPMIQPIRNDESSNRTIARIVPASGNRVKSLTTYEPCLLHHENKSKVARMMMGKTMLRAITGTRRATHSPAHNGSAIYKKIALTNESIGRSFCLAACGTTSTATGVMTMLTSENTAVIPAANASRLATLLVNCMAIGVPELRPGATGRSSHRE